MDNCWLDLDGVTCLEMAPQGHYGYIYQITVKKHKSIPKELWGKIYVGKKCFTHATKKKVTKKEIKISGTRKRIERGVKDSGWLKYWGSSKELLVDIKLYGEEYFERAILCYCSNKSELSYKETEIQFEKKVLYCNSYNKWISIKCYRHLLNKL